MNYKNGKIYAIRSNETEKFYIGSTTQRLHKRFYEHKTKRDCTSRYMFTFPDVYIELIENYPCNSKEELHKREGEYIRQSNTINKNIAGRNIAEYYIDNIEKYKETNLKFRADNPDYGNKYYEINKEKYNKIIACDCGGKYCVYTKFNHLKTKKHIKYLLSLTGDIDD